ncbi:MAG TPA: hypothetical protein VIN10_06960 [Bacteroidales bacterium]
MNSKPVKYLAITFVASGIWDTIAGIMYFFFIGDGRIIDNPAVHPFYTIFLGSFFICFAYLQFLSALNIRHYIFNVGCLIIGRIFYVVQLFYFIRFVPGFPSTFWMTGIIDGTFVILYIVFAIRSGFGFRDLFLPTIERVNM